MEERLGDSGNYCGAVIAPRHPVPMLHPVFTFSRDRCHILSEARLPMADQRELADADIVIILRGHECKCARRMRGRGRAWDSRCVL